MNPARMLGVLLWDSYDPDGSLTGLDMAERIRRCIEEHPIYGFRLVCMPALTPDVPHQLEVEDRIPTLRVVKGELEVGSQQAEGEGAYSIQLQVWPGFAVRGRNLRELRHELANVATAVESWLELMTERPTFESGDRPPDD